MADLKISTVFTFKLINYPVKREDRYSYKSVPESQDYFMIKGQTGQLFI